MCTLKRVTRNSFCLAILCGVAVTGAVHAEAVQQTQVKTASLASQSTEARYYSLLSAPAQLHVENVPLEAALRSLQSATGIVLAYSPTVIRDSWRVTCTCSESEAGDALARLLIGTGLEFAELAGLVIIRKKDTPQVALMLENSGRTRPADLSGPVYAGSHAGAPINLMQTGEIRGQVFDARTRQPLSAVQVYVRELDLGVLSREDGSFFLANVPVGTHVLRARRIGYGDAVKEVVVQADQVAIATFEISQQALALDEIVVTGAAGQARRREVGHTIAQIRMTDVQAPVMNVDNLLQGRAAGVSVLQSSGSTGAGAVIRLRGNVSVAMSNQPLIYVDGVRVRSDGYPKSVSPVGFQGNSSNINPSPINDINPADIDRIEVIKGAAATTLYGTEAAAGVIQIFTKRGATGKAIWTGQMDQGIDWIRPFVRGEEPFFRIDPWLSKGWRQRYSLSVQGGGSDAQYFVSALWDNNDGVLPKDSEERAAIRGNVSFSPNSVLRIDWNTSYVDHYISNTGMGNGIHSLGLNAFRGDFNIFGDGRKEVIDQILENDIETHIGRFISGVTANYNMRENIYHRVTVGYDRVNMEARQTRPFGYALTPRGEMSNRLWSNETRTFDYVGNLQLDLTRDLRSRFSWGAQSVETMAVDLQTHSQDFPGPGSPTLSTGASQVAREERVRVITAGFFGQQMLDYKDRYFFTVGVRVDGNSAFGRDFGLQYYPKFNASYVISEEGFWPESFGQVKLRGAYGQAGRAPGAFDAVRTWDPVDWRGESAFHPRNVGNPNLGPERTSEIEIGFDGAFLSDRLSLDVTHYRQAVTDALFRVVQIPSEGFGASQLMNVGGIENSGFEITANGEILQRESVQWELGLTLATNKSEVVDLGGAPAFSAGQSAWIREGHPVPVLVGSKIMNPHAYEEPEFERDHEFGSTLPKYTIAPSSRLSLGRGIVLTAGGEYMGGHYISDGPSEHAAPRGIAPQCLEAYRLLEDGRRSELTAQQRARCDVTTVDRTMFVYPADFFRFRELSISVPVTRVVPGATRAGMTLSARNFWTWKNKELLAFDSETMGNDPMFRMDGRVNEMIPPPSSFTASIRVSF
jgi:TonB-dependent starch-binding outer membrane protein SusC